MISIPRFQGRAFKENSSWGWELMISIAGEQSEKPIYMIQKPVFINERSALLDMNQKLPEIMKTVCRAMGLPTKFDIQDLNKGIQATEEEWMQLEKERLGARNDYAK